MIKPYELLEGVLNEIESNLKDDINYTILADKFDLSTGYLRNLFKFAFNQSLGAYIRSRKLAVSINDLLNTDMNIVDIVMEYGFEYEQSYIRAFKREFGVTPGELRKSGRIVKITPPLHLFDSNRLADGLIFGPDIVMVPQFHVIGKKYRHTFRDALVLDPIMAKQFFIKERMSIPNTLNPDVHINIGMEADAGVDYCYFLPAVQVKTLNTIPEGFDGFTFPSSLCANFRFIGSDGADLNMAVADGMFKAIDDFMGDENQRYFLERKRINFEKITSSSPGGSFGRWEWFAPVIEKNSLKIASSKSSGIQKVYKQEVPALRFIGKKCAELAETCNILKLLDDWRINGGFDVIEKQAKGADAYIHLMRRTEDGNVEHRLGMFMPQGTNVPDGCEAIDFPASTLAVCSVYGKRDEVVDYEAMCREKMAAEGFTPENARYYFRRFNWHLFFEDDVYGKRMLDFGCFLGC